jgi:hypothetical protein
MHYVNTTIKAEPTPGTTPERYQDIIAERKYYNIQYIYLNEGEAEEYELLLDGLHLI